MGVVGAIAHLDLLAGLGHLLARQGPADPGRVEINVPMPTLPPAFDPSQFR
jgi:hypothetical protein